MPEQPRRLTLDAAPPLHGQILAALDKSRRVPACLDLLAAFLRALPDPAPTASTARPPVPPPEEAAAAAEATEAAKAAGKEGPVKPGSGEVSGGAGAGGAGNGARRSEADLARALVGVAKLLHDSLDLLSSHERQRQASSRRRGQEVGVERGWPSRVGAIPPVSLLPHAGVGGSVVQARKRTRACGC